MNLWRKYLLSEKKLFAPTDRVLGVVLRGTDYLVRRIHNHPIQPPLEFATSMAVAKLKEWDCNKIFLATEDKIIVQIFKKFFGSRCIILDFSTTADMV